ncbi:MAG TPA: hypothetical protein V6C58_05680 [Allocoleopsis sp.]
MNNLKSVPTKYKISSEQNLKKSDRKLNYQVWWAIMTLIINAIAPLILPQKAEADIWDSVGKIVNKVGDTLAPIVDVTDKRSAARRILREFDVTSPNSAACRAIKTEGAGKIAETISTAYKAPGAGTAIISVLQGTCTRSGGGNNQKEADQAADAMADAWNSAVEMKRLEVEGKTEQTRIIQNSLVEITKAQTAADVEKARINLAAVTARANADVKIEALRQQGRKEEAEILSNQVQKIEELKQKGATERVKLETENLLAMTKENNAVKLRELDLNASIKRQELTNSLIGQGIGAILGYFNSKAELEKEREITKREIEQKKLDLEIAKVQAGLKKPPETNTNPSGQNTNPPVVEEDNNIALLRSWGLTPTECTPAMAFISIDSKQYCTLPNNGLTAKQYIYNRSTNKLTAVINQLPEMTKEEDPNINLIQSWGLAMASSCNIPVAMIFIDNKQYCTLPTSQLNAGKYVYNRATKKLKPMSVNRPDPEGGFK